MTLLSSGKGAADFVFANGTKIDSECLRGSEEVLNSLPREMFLLGYDPDGNLALLNDSDCLL